MTIWVGEIDCGPLCAYGAHFHLRRAGWGWYVESYSDAFISELTRPAKQSDETNHWTVDSGNQGPAMETYFLALRFLPRFLR